MENSDKIDEVYEEVAREALISPNALWLVTISEIDMFGKEGDEDLLDYYMNKYIKTHEQAVSLM